LVADTPGARLPDDLARTHCRVCEQAWTPREQPRLIERMQDRLEILLRHLYGRRNEKPSPGQILSFGDATI